MFIAVCIVICHYISFSKMTCSYVSFPWEYSWTSVTISSVAESVNRIYCSNLLI